MSKHLLSYQGGGWRMGGTLHWFNHEGSTFRYELKFARYADVMSYRAKVWRDGIYLGEIQSSVMRQGAAVDRWTDSAVELLAVLGAERAIRSRNGITW
ncbi:hypothetical protein [Dyella sp. 20L07]|uniref:hypothetical protein n=1 Tax=Dyella sp. 20L07 TaxID=3384240 RepID=UPI003D2CFAA1